MRILFLTPAFPPSPGGGERYARSLALSLVEFGHEITVLTGAACQEQEMWLGSRTAVSITREVDDTLRLIRLPVQSMPGGRRAFLAWRKCMVLLGALPFDTTSLLRRMALRIPNLPLLKSTLRSLPRPDLIHGFNLSWEAPLVAGWQAAAAWRVPLVVTPFAHFGGGKLDRVALNNTMPHQVRLLSDAAAVLTLTDIEADNLGRYGARPGRYVTIGGGLAPPPRLTRKDEKFYRQLGIDPPFILFIGRASYDKGAIHALQAVLSVNKTLERPLTLGFIGQSTPDLEQAVSKLADDERTAVRILGHLEETEKHALLAACELLLLPSRTDSFGLVFLEAWAHGKPVIGADAGGIPGLVDDEINGLLVPFGDVTRLGEAIRHLVSDGDKSRALGEQGRQKLQTQYTWEQVAGRVDRVYNELR